MEIILTSHLYMQLKVWLNKLKLFNECLKGLAMYTYAMQSSCIPCTSIMKMITLLVLNTVTSLKDVRIRKVLDLKAHELERNGIESKDIHVIEFWYLCFKNKGNKHVWPLCLLKHVFIGSTKDILPNHVLV